MKKHRPGTTRVPYSINGRTRMVEVDPPEMPRDLDHTVLKAVTTVCALMLVAAVAWSTVNIAGLLVRLGVPEWAAYGAAAVFDLAWIVCMALEWLARSSPQRSKLPAVAGWVALAVAMVAVGVHGHLDGMAEVGLLAAAVSGIVKGVWTIVLRHYSAPLDPLTQQWAEQELAAAHAQIGLAGVEKELLRTQHQIARMREAYGLPAIGQRLVPQLDPAPAEHEAPHDDAPAVALIPAGHAPAAAPVPMPAAASPATVEDPVQLARIIDARLVGAGSKAEMVRRVRKVVPAWTSEQVADELKRRGVEISAGYVRSVDSRPAPKQPVEQPEPRLPEQPPLIPPGTGGYA